MTLEMMTLGQLIEELKSLKDQKEALNDQIKAINAQVAEVNEAILQKMDEQGLERGEGTSASVYINRSVKAEVIDFDAFGEYIIETNSLHLLNRAVNNAACRELFERGDTIPGVMPRQYRTLNIRSARVK